MKSKNAVMNLITVLTILLVIGMLIPFIYVSKFAYPWADDFSYGAPTREVFEATGSVLQTIVAAVESVKYVWNDWQGTYTSCFLMALQPAVWNVKLYHLTGVMMVGSMLLAYLALGFVLWKKIFRMSWQVSVSAMLIVFFASVQMAPGIAEGFTWYNSAVHYTFMHAMYVFFVAGVLSLLSDVVRSESHDGGSGAEQKRKMGVAGAILRVVLLSLLAIVVAGGNNITTLAGMLTVLLTESALLFYYLVYTGGREKSVLKASKLMLPVTIAYLAGFALNILAPGNQKRMAISVEGRKTDYLAIIMNAFQVAYADIKVKMTLELWMVILIVAVLVWYAFTKCGALDKVRFSFPLPLLVVLASYCFLSALYCPMLLVTDLGDEFRYIFIGVTEVARTENVIFFFMVLLTVVDIVYLLGWLYKKGLHAGSGVISLVLAAVAIVICVITCRNMLSSFERTYLTAAAVRDIRNQTAQYYGYQMAVNTQRLTTDEQDVLVMPIAVDPKILYPYDAADWKEGARLFYNKNSVEYESEPYKFDR